MTRYEVTWLTLEVLFVLSAVKLSPTASCSLASCITDLVSKPVLNTCYTNGAIWRFSQSIHESEHVVTALERVFLEKLIVVQLVVRHSD